MSQKSLVSRYDHLILVSVTFIGGDLVWSRLPLWRGVERIALPHPPGVDNKGNHGNGQVSSFRLPCTIADCPVPEFSRHPSPPRLQCHPGRGAENFPFCKGGSDQRNKGARWSSRRPVKGHHPDQPLAGYWGPGNRPIQGEQRGNPSCKQGEFSWAHASPKECETRQACAKPQSNAQISNAALHV